MIAAQLPPQLPEIGVKDATSEPASSLSKLWASARRLMIATAYGVKNRLFWSSFVDDREVSVVVEDGQVTLTGTVDDRAAFREATQAAIEAGASEVDNRLIVRELAIE